MEIVKFFPSRHHVNFAQRRYNTGRHEQSVPKIPVVWDVTLCHWISTLRRFEIPCCLDLWGQAAQKEYLGLLDPEDQDTIIH